MLELRLLGQFDVRHKGIPIEVPSRPAQSLLAYLALMPGLTHRREKLAGMFWPEASDSQARNNLRYTLWQVRKALGRPGSGDEDYLVADKIAVGFDPQADIWVDAAELMRHPAGPQEPEGLS